MKTKTYKNEGDVKAEVKRILKEQGFFYWMPAANGYGMQGVADFCALKDGVFFAIETKFGNSKPTANQMKFLQKVATKKGVAVVVNDRNVIVLEEMLDGLLTAALVSRALRES